MKRIIDKILGLKTAYKVSLTIALIVILWVISGLFADRKPEVSNHNNIIKKIAKVTVIKSTPQDFNSSVTLYGNTESSNKIDIKARTSGRIASTEGIEGSIIKKGDMILTINMDARESELSKAKATVRHRELEYKAANSLLKKGYGSENKLAETQSLLEEAKTNLRKIELDIQYTKVVAPFDGLLDQVYVDVGELVTENQTILATFMNNDPFLAVGYISQTQRESISSNMKAKVKLIGKYGEINREVDGFVRFISKVANESTKTFRVEVEIPNTDNNISHGQTAEITIYTEKIKAHLIPASALTLNSDGNIGIKVVNENRKVKFYKISIISETENGIYVNILNDGIMQQDLNIIVIGQNFVNEGDEVEFHYMEENDTSQPMAFKIGNHVI